jgi:transaldolase
MRLTAGRLEGWPKTVRERKERPQKHGAYSDTYSTGVLKMGKSTNQSIEDKIHEFLKGGFSPRFGKSDPELRTDKRWQKCRDLGTELWLDTGSPEDISKCWTRQFSAVTTNNTLLNAQVQTGRYDKLVADLRRMLEEYDLDENRKKMEYAFVLNAYHALRLVERFDAYVSVEEHTDLAFDAQAALEYARRYYAVCPERFIVKIPFTPAGLLATRKAANEGIPVNHTLGFSARQNYLIARIGRPRFVNVFLGRLNAFVNDNHLGTGEYVGERAAIASNAAVNRLRQAGAAPSRQIAASLRDGQQVASLVGVDVLTMPPKVASQYMEMEIPLEQITDRSGAQYEIGVGSAADVAKCGLNMLWEVPDRLVRCVDRLEKENLEDCTPDQLIDFFHENGCGDMMVRWTDKQTKTSMREGKIPHLENWKDALVEKKIGLDSLMNLAGLCSFSADQKAMDDRVKSVLEKTD